MFGTRNSTKHNQIKLLVLCVSFTGNSCMIDGRKFVEGSLLEVKCPIGTTRNYDRFPGDTMCENGKWVKMGIRRFKKPVANPPGHLTTRQICSESKQCGGLRNPSAVLSGRFDHTSPNVDDILGFRLLDIRLYFPENDVSDHDSTLCAQRRGGILRSVRYTQR